MSVTPSRQLRPLQLRLDMRYRLLQQEDEVELDGSLRVAIQLAVRHCPGIDEEEGGFIVRREQEFEFHHVKNQHTGTPVAVGFYEPEPQEYGDKIIQSYSRRFYNYGSFHTHPTGCRALPSMTDLTRLFNGQPHNFIWSPSLNELNWFEFAHDDKTEIAWIMKRVKTDGLL